MITEDEIMEILRSKLYEEEMRGFYINKRIFSIDTCGVIEIKGGWFSWYTYDRSYTVITGPFFDKDIIYEIAKRLHYEAYFAEYKYPHEDIRYGKYRCFHSLEEAGQYMDELNKNKTESLSRLAGTLSNLSSEKRIK